MKKRVLLDCEHDSDLKAAAKLYKEGKITIREASDITRIPLRGILHEFGKMGIFIRYLWRHSNVWKYHPFLPYNPTSNFINSSSSARFFTTCLTIKLKIGSVIL